MFFRKKELTFDEETAITRKQLQQWVDFMQTEIEGEADNVEIADLGDRKVGEIKRIIKSFQSVISFLEFK